MPIFAYKCQGCSHQFDLLVHASTIPSCPECQATNLEKQLTVLQLEEQMEEWTFQVGQEAADPAAIREAPERVR